MELYYIDKEDKEYFKSQILDITNFEHITDGLFQLNNPDWTGNETTLTVYNTEDNL